MQRAKRLSDVSSFGIGGPADYFTTVTTVENLVEALRFSAEKHIPFFILGRGSNCLFDDAGYRGLVIQNRIDNIVFQGNQVDVGSGFSFSLLGTQTARRGFSGLEFASGIPGTVGGAVFMNAGANGKETRDCLSSVLFVYADGKIEEFTRDQIEFSYRYSSFHNMKGVIARATFQLQNSPEARALQINIIKKRVETQPLNEKSAGCIFRNPNNFSAGALIEKSGMKGSRIGGAEVSEKHANFIVNRGNATARDVLNLVELINKTVVQKTGIKLEMEVRYIPENYHCI